MAATLVDPQAFDKMENKRHGKQFQVHGHAQLQLTACCTQKALCKTPAHACANQHVKKVLTINSQVSAWCAIEVWVVSSYMYKQHTVTVVCSCGHARSTFDSNAQTTCAAEQVLLHVGLT